MAVGSIPDRRSMYEAWERYYKVLPRDLALETATAYVTALRGRMVLLGRAGSRFYKGYVTRELNLTLGMSLGIHQQVLKGLTFSTLGGYPDGWRGGTARKSGWTKGPATLLDKEV